MIMVLVKIKLPQSVLSIDKAAKARAAQNISSELDSTVSAQTLVHWWWGSQTESEFINTSLDVEYNYSDGDFRIEFSEP